CILEGRNRGESSGHGGSTRPYTVHPAALGASRWGRLRHQRAGDRRRRRRGRRRGGGGERGGEPHGSARRPARAPARGGSRVSREPARGHGSAPGGDRGARSVSWFDKLIPPKIKSRANRKAVPEGLWRKCPACGAVLYSAEIDSNHNVCPKCNHHMRLGARRRLDLFLDPEPREEIGANLAPIDVLKFKDLKRYKDRLNEAQRETGERDALVVMRGALKGAPLVACAFEFNFMGGSMGSVVGERFVRGVNACLEARMPLVCFSASGGARMQEGLFSLLQMSKDRKSTRLNSSHVKISYAVF